MEENKIIDPNVNPQPEKGMTFEDYKREANLDDIKKMEYNLKPRWFENVPIIGAFIYSIRMTIRLYGIDRGLLRKEIMKVRLLFTFLFLVYIYAFIMAITPWFNYWQFRIAIKKARKRIAENDPIKV